MSGARIAHVATVDLTLRFLLLPQLIALRDAGFDVATISAPGPWVADIEAEGIRHIPWRHATRSWDLRADALAFRELLEIFRRERFDLVHTHNPKPGVLGRIAGRVAGVPRVLNTVHGLYATPEDGLRRRAPVLAAEWIAARCSDLELYQSEEDLSWARRLHVTRPGRSLLLGNGIDVSRFTPALAGEERVRKLRAELGLGEDELVVGTVGRMVLEKGYAEFFAAAQEVREQIRAVRFVVVGEGDPEKPDAVTATQVERAAGDVVFAGWREDIPELMALMDVFVLPSWREGLPRSAIEAAASGLPLVLTDIRGCREVVRDGIEGLLVPVRDPRTLAGAIIRLLDEPELRVRMGAAARARAEDRFDERRVMATVVHVTQGSLQAAGRLSSRGARASGPRIRRARTADAVSMARLHAVSMPTAFLPTLGRAFLVRLYRGLIQDRHAIAMVADDGRRVVGVATAVPSVGAFYRRFAFRRGVFAAIAAAPKLRPTTVRRAIETARYPSTANDLPTAELLSIAVDDSSRSDGVGSALVSAIAERLALAGVPDFKAVVGMDNAGANRFYERNGFVLAGSIAVHEGERSNVWTKRCRS